eukprot:CAMPEP_0197596692 /NCGR_PEP_ID=MMETSP1326-20131121/25666_1 /TAXON_ID=1155430 /ORGANISM="Genus nov. species nov., Strain RCC2288" /LENGTH=67 /DNA_ID=CAMNT_0043163245 /DNA_START=126 /DNA_END=326 /DNA_ORIENTATION=+
MPDTFGPGGSGHKLPDGFANFKDYRLSKEPNGGASTAPKHEPWTWAQWATTAIVAVLVVAAIIFVLP